jgi:hypothetical protein
MLTQNCGEETVLCTKRSLLVTFAKQRQWQCNFYPEEAGCVHEKLSKVADTGLWQVSTCAKESDMLKVKVPLICPSTGGVPALRDGRYFV